MPTRRSAGPHEGAEYPLSPMQAGMLFQYLLAGGRSGFDIEQMHITTGEVLDARLLARAWTQIARRHPVLSTRFRWEDVPQAVQSPQPDVTVSVEVEDWGEIGDDERERRLADLLARDRRRGFDLKVAPLLRVTLLRMASRPSELVWTFHHILLDGRSFAPVLQEVFAVYASLRDGTACDLPPAPRPYAAYLGSLAASAAGGGLAYFAELLAGKTSPTPLPCAEPATKPLARDGYGEASRRVEARVVEAAREAVRRTQTTMGTLVQAAWALVLSRLTGEDDVVFGSTRACRRSAGPDAESMIGLFINTLPVRARVPATETVGGLLGALRAQTVRTRAHEQTPLVDIHGASEMARGLPLFETLVVFENRDLDRVLRASGDPGWASRSCTLHEQPSFPLTLTVVDDEAVAVRILFDRRRFTDAAAARIASYVETALGALAVGEHRHLAELDVLPPEERRRLLVEWNDTARAFPEDACIQDPFEARALLQPDAVAVEMDGVAVSFRELDARANRIAQALVARGAGPGKYVGVCLGRGPGLVAALLGVAKSGAAYVPLDPEYPLERLSFILDEARAILVVTDEANRGLFTRETLVVSADGRGAEVDPLPDARPPRTATSRDVCYVIFTSGSTGKPKGVVLSHRAVVNTFDWVSRTFAVGPGDRLLFVTSPCFDLSVYDTFGALGAGATVVVASAPELADPQMLAEAVVRERITIWDSAPAALQRLMSFFPVQGAASPLRLVMLSGDWIPVHLPDEVRRTFPGARVMSLGGATEAAIWSNWFPIGEIDPRWASIPYGRPIQNARYHVLDARRQPAPIGVAGDLYIGGACLADGYLNRPDLTSERFLDDPFRPGERLYATGDLARHFEDGDLEFLGRADFQVKIRGFRVELGEVEAVLSDAPGVHEVVCAAYADASGQKALAAYVVAREGASLDERAVKAHAAAKLPEYMIPAQVIALAEWPLSSNGKLDRKALPSPTGHATSERHVPPATEIERKLAAIWEELLQRDAVGLTDGFFDLGGHSLLAVMVMTRIERDLGVRLPLSVLVESPTIGALARALESSQKTPGHVLAMNGAGVRPPLVVVSGVGGFGLLFRGLSRSLGGEQPVFALNAVGSEDEEEGTDHSIEDIAAIYEPEVLAACPDGPIVLGGYSFGILVAFELARRLRAMGRRVPLLCSFDGFAPGYPKLLPLPTRVAAHVRAIAGRSAADRTDYLRDRFRNVGRRILTAIGRAEEAFDVPDAADPETARRLRKVVAGLWRARGQYRPEFALDSDLLLVKAEIQTRWHGNEDRDPFYGWQSFVRGNIHVATVPGEHLRMFDGTADREIAEAVVQAMDRLGLCGPQSAVRSVVTRELPRAQSG